MLSYDLVQPIGEGLVHEIGHIDYVINLASESHVDNSIKDPRGFVKNNIDLQLTMLEYAKHNPVERFLQFSTDEVPSTAPEGVDYDEAARPNPGNAYSASKAAQEMLCRAYANTYKMPICITRCMNVIGEKQHPEKFLPKIMNYVLEDKTLNIHASPDGKFIGKRHYIHARNVADAVLFVLENTDEVLHHIDEEKGMYNITGEVEYDNLEFAQLVAKFMGIELDYAIVSMAEERPGVDLRYALDGEKLAQLGWTPSIGAEDTVKSIVEWTLKEENLKWLKE
jgi:dTDP-D-glucose 4,6-dehydratase